MTDEATPILPRKKPSAMWIVFGAFFVILLLFCLQLFGPNPPILVSRETTYITSPLGPDGLPDYERYILERYRKGVTPENNAAVLLWQALGPGDLDPSQQAIVARELGTTLPDPDAVLAKMHGETNRKRVAAWLNAQRAAPLDSRAAANRATRDDPATSVVPIGSEDDIIYDTIDAANSGAWKSDDLPPMAYWITENAASFDLLLEASRRPHLYWPNELLLNGSKDMLVVIWIESFSSLRDAARVLSARGRWHLGEGRLADARNDFLAIHRLARLSTQSGTTIGALVGIALDGIACEATLDLLDHPQLTPEQARQVQSDLATLPPFTIGAAYDSYERLCVLDALVHTSAGGTGELLAWSDITGERSFTPLSLATVDWNIVLRETNRRFDQLVAAMRQPTRAARTQAIMTLQNDLLALEDAAAQPWTWAKAVFARPIRSEFAAALCLDLLFPSFVACADAQDRANNQLDLVRLAAALAIYRAEHGSYPEKLDDLVPNVIDALPTDLYHARPFVYQRTTDGYLLYSTGPNGIDDGGSNEQMSTFEGRSVNDLDDPDEAQKLSENIPGGSDDPAIRMPRPRFKLPKLQGDAPPAE